MHRFALIPLAAGVVLLVSWIAAPAAPRPLGADEMREMSPQSAAVTEVDAQVKRLRERLSAPVDYPPPVRNPFRFVPKAEPRRAPARDLVDPSTIAPAPPVLPVLIAITTPPGSDPARTAIIRTGADDIRMVKTGEKFGDLIVSRIDADAIELIDPSTSKSYRILLQ